MGYNTQVTVKSCGLLICLLKCQYFTWSFISSFSPCITKSSHPLNFFQVGGEDLYPCTTSYSLLQVLLRNPFLDLHCSLQSIFLKWNQVQGLSQLQTPVSTTWSYQDRLMKLHYHLKRNFLHCTIMHFWLPFMVYFE